ncbi:hypothetical protein [Algibacillus agarilyticus]|uniref:hypothetical protein n=1 Tax=Algibacillus agarilyticus TaxID=2234133 RepID=UPI0013002C71|nr:hypothetical protein [Algibacillus agarilyticus]
MKYITIFTIPMLVLALSACGDKSNGGSEQEKPLANTPVNTQPDTPVNTQPDKPVDTQPDTPVDTQPDTPVDTQPDTPVDAQPDTPVDTQPDTPVDAQPDPDTTWLYKQEGTDLTWEEVLATDALLPLYTFTYKGVLGSIISINHALIETGEYGSRPINSVENKYSLHTVGNPAIGQSKFERWSRWYQESGNTQIFRLFKNEENVSNSRPLAARVEISSSKQRWFPEPGIWREFSARFTVLKAKGCSALPVKGHYCSIFQAKGNNVDHWSVMLRVHGDGSLWFYPREGIYKNRKKLRDNVIGQPFDMKVRDNGLDYEMWIDGESVGTGQWQRTLEIGFRWGIYVGETEVVDDILVLVTGASVK